MTDPADISLYVHWPYCARICPYCDFNVYRDRAIDAGRWIDALRRDIDWWAEQTPGRRLASLYFGGGTPSLAPAALVAGVFEHAKSRWTPGDDIEVTLEANPTDAEADRFRAFRDAGVNRLSLGLQSFDDAALRFLGRNHDGAGAARALDAALAIFAEVTFDLIYALPRQSLADWRRDLLDAAARGAAHMSLYQLTIEPGTAFDKAVARNAWAPPDDDLGADLFDATQAIMTEAGLPAYEISNHARPGHESRHNFVYWRGGDYAGVGPGAHGRLTQRGVRRAIETERDPAAYLARVDASGTGCATDEQLTEAEWRMERYTMGLRTTEGVIAPAADIAAFGDRLGALVDDGLLEREGARLVATPAGRRLLNFVASRLFA